ncbi:MAG: pyrroline-5-carboxylate reductase [Promethearchaeota archaeon]
MTEKNLGLIGIGNMGNAFLTSLLRDNGNYYEKYCIFDVNKDKTAKFKGNGKINICSDVQKVVEMADTIILIVKPQNMRDVLLDIQPLMLDYKKFITIAMGLPIEFYRNYLGEKCYISRVMPNTPYLVSAGAAGITLDPKLSTEDAQRIKKIFTLSGKVIECKEELLDVVTGLSGNGPAYFFIMIEALADGAVKMGLSREDAYLLTAQTMLGSAKLVLESGKHPGVLKDMVTSPGGTAISSIRVLEREKIRSTLIEAVIAGTKKSKDVRDKSIEKLRS